MSTRWIELSDGEIFNLDAYMKIECFECGPDLVRKTPKYWKINIRHSNKSFDEEIKYEDADLWQEDIARLKQKLSIKG